MQSPELRDTCPRSPALWPAPCCPGNVTLGPGTACGWLGPQSSLAPRRQPGCGEAVPTQVRPGRGRGAGECSRGQRRAVSQRSAVSQRRAVSQSAVSQRSGSQSGGVGAPHVAGVQPLSSGVCVRKMGEGAGLASRPARFGPGWTLAGPWGWGRGLRHGVLQKQAECVTPLGPQELPWKIRAEGVSRQRDRSRPRWTEGHCAQQGEREAAKPRVWFRPEPGWASRKGLASQGWVRVVTSLPGRAKPWDQGWDGHPWAAGEG